MQKNEIIYFSGWDLKIISEYERLRKIQNEEAEEQFNWST